MVMENPNYFSKYGKDFQEKIFQALLKDHNWSAQMIEIMQYDYFELKYLQFLCDRFFSFYTEYRNFPTLQLLVSMIKDELTAGDDIILREQVIEYLTRMKSSPNLGDLKFVKAKTLDFCKKQALQQALEESVKAIKQENYESVLNIMKEAVNTDIFIMDSFLNIYAAGSGSTPHKHISNFDKNHELIDQKFSLTYYLDVGDQNCDEPGNLKVYDPDEEILPSNGTIVIFPANRKHLAVYGGKTDRVMIGVNFYSLI